MARAFPIDTRMRAAGCSEQFVARFLGLDGAEDRERRVLSFDLVVALLGDLRRDEQRWEEGEGDVVTDWNSLRESSRGGSLGRDMRSSSARTTPSGMMELRAILTRTIPSTNRTPPAQRLTQVPSSSSSALISSS